MLRTTPAAPIGTTAKVPPQSAAPAVREAPGARTRGRHRNRREHGRVKTGVVVALSCGLLAAGTTFAVHLGLAAARVNAPAASAPSAGTAGRGASATTLQVLSVSPDNSADPLTPANPVRIVFSAPLTAKSPLPTFSPAVPGRWRSVGNNTIVFTPSAAVAATTEETLLIPGGRSGERSVTGLTLTASVTAVFQAGGWSTLRLEQLLAQLGYLPMTWNPSGSSQPGSNRGGQLPEEAHGHGRSGQRRAQLADRVPGRAHHPVAARKARRHPRRSAHGVRGQSRAADDR